MNGLLLIVGSVCLVFALGCFQLRNLGRRHPNAEILADLLDRLGRD